MIRFISARALETKVTVVWQALEPL